YIIFFLIDLPPPRSTLFPYTTLFRSCDRRHAKPALSFGGHERVAHQPRERLAQRSCADAVLRAQVLDAQLAAGHEAAFDNVVARSEEHTSELQSRENLVCRLLLEKKK